MQKFSAFDARRRFSGLLHHARKEPVAITRYNRPAAYLISADAFREFRRLRREALLAEMTRLVARLDAAGNSNAPELYRELDRLTKRAAAEAASSPARMKGV